MKKVQEYLNDPRLLNDPAMIGALEPIKLLDLLGLRLKVEPKIA